MPTECENCGNTVSDSYARVQGDRNGRVRSCPECNGNDSDGAYTAAVGGTTHTLNRA